MMAPSSLSPPRAEGGRVDRAARRAHERDLTARAKTIAPDVLDPPIARRLAGALAVGGAVLAIAVLVALLDVDPSAFAKGGDNLVRFLAMMARPNDGGMPDRIYGALLETFAMAVLATAIALVVALPVGALAARTVLRGPAHFTLRLVLGVMRGIPALVWALVLVSALGLGPLAGIIALALADTPYLAKFFAEALENIDERPRDAVRAAGGGAFADLRYAVAPQTAPLMASQTLYMLEANFRTAAILGIVGAGGIGFELDERIRIFAFDQVSYILIVYVVCVMALDFVSAAIRRRLS
jgi:phosphonate transport system permease protein